MKLKRPWASSIRNQSIFKDDDVGLDDDEFEEVEEEFDEDDDEFDEEDELFAGWPSKSHLNGTLWNVCPVSTFSSGLT